jgi:hypothetical protein
VIFSSTRWLPVIRPFPTYGWRSSALPQSTVCASTYSDLVIIYEKAQSIFRNWHSLSYQRTLPFHSHTTPQWIPACIEFTQTHTRFFGGFILTLSFHLRTDSNLLRSEFPLLSAIPCPNHSLIIHNKSINTVPTLELSNNNDDYEDGSITAVFCENNRASFTVCGFPSLGHQTYTEPTRRNSAHEGTHRFVVVPWSIKRIHILGDIGLSVHEVFNSSLPSTCAVHVGWYKRV